MFQTDKSKIYLYRIRKKFLIPNISITEPNAFFDTKFCRYRIRFFFFDTNFLIPNPILVSIPNPILSKKLEKFRKQEVSKCHTLFTILRIWISVVLNQFWHRCKRRCPIPLAPSSLISPRFSPPISTLLIVSQEN